MGTVYRKYCPACDADAVFRIWQGYVAADISANVIALDPIPHGVSSQNQNAI